MAAPDPAEPPDIEARWKFSVEKWDHEYARNVVLHYIKEKGLQHDLLQWLDTNYPDEGET